VTESEHWFEPVAEHLGSAYLRYSFTKGTANEADFIVDQLGLEPGRRVLDVGCGPGRHAHDLGRRGIEVVGIDISQRFVDLARQDAPPGVRFERADARRLDYNAEFDAAISLCQGAFGLVGAGPGTTIASTVDPDGDVLAGMARAVKPGGGVAVSAFSSYFMVKHLEETDSFDAARGVNHEATSVRSQDGDELDVDLWTSCFTPRELRLLAASAGLAVEALYSVTPGAYRADPPDLEHPEFLMIARRPPEM
jgi:SAM-dependent methyltransferase